MGEHYDIDPNDFRALRSDLSPSDERRCAPRVVGVPRPRSRRVGYLVNASPPKGLQRH
jgi:hypothetical protein